MVVVASVLPAHGVGMILASSAGTAAIALMFFLQGARLSPQAALAGARHWRLHALVLASTFLIFPAIGLTLHALAPKLLTAPLWAGLLMLCLLPSTVQSSIAFTSIARGNVPAAVCSASASTLLGVFVSPVLVSLVVLPHSAGSTNAFDSIGRILLQLMLPFAAGHLLRPWISGWLHRQKEILGIVDRGSILLVVYTAFSAAVIEGLWKQVPLQALAGLLLVCAVLLGSALFLTGWLARRLGFDKADEITIVFCGSKKSMASGIPMARVLFPAQSVGAVVLPLMLFHQMQLMVCAVLAQRYARRVEASPVSQAAGQAG
jgi:sodium/bile acid cotransporter 7